MTEPTGPGTRPDLDAAEEFAESVGVDPTQEEITRYRQLEGDFPDEEATPSPAIPASDPSVS